MSKTSIEWTSETWNPVTGCSKVSPGCAHCYAEAVALRFWPLQYPHIEMMTAEAVESGESHTRPREFEDVQCHADRLDQPLRRKKPTTYFVNSMSDLFHEDVPDAFIDRVFAVMALAPQHTFQILTKRAERMRQWFTETRNGCSRHAFVAKAAAAIWDALPERERWRRFKVGSYSVGAWPLPNVWLGVSVENQHLADERIPLLLQTPAAVRFISAEPLLGPIECSFDTELGPLSWLERHTASVSTGSEPSCFTNTGTPAALHCSMIDDAQSRSNGRAPLPLSPPTITQSTRHERKSRVG